MSKLYNRKTKKLEEEKQYKVGYLKFLYNTVIGRILLKFLICPFISKLDGLFNDSFISKLKIKNFIRDNNIDMSLYEEKKYKNFNDFFTRKKINIKINCINKEFISCADSKLMVYKIEDNLMIKVKNSYYTLNELLDSNENLDKYKNGNCLVFRLAVDDYHRYCFIDSGTLKHSKYIKGKLHTVSSFSEKYKIYSQNSRVCNYLKTDNFGDIIYIEVGALLVGRIVNHNISKFKKGEEKGYFKMGGSTVVILTKDNVKIDDDILKNSLKNIETKVSYGEKIGKLI